jgi:uncharacterized protein YndB with AHSA1/START domain
MATPLQLTTPSDLEVVVSRQFDAPRDLVFDCHTKPELVRRWLLGPPGWTMPICEIDLRVRGRYRYLWRGPDGEELGLAGTFHEVVRPERLVSVELYDQDWTGGETRITSRFAERDGQTTSTMTIVYASPEARAGALATGMTDGMEMGYRNLDKLLAEQHAR